MKTFFSSTSKAPAIDFFFYSIIFFSILYECLSINAIVCWLVLLKFILMLMTIKFPLKMSERAFVCQLTLLNIDTYSNIIL